MAKHHLIITGTGRAGTTFLVQLLTELRLDTGFKDSAAAICPVANAGMEFDLRQPNAPYIVKSAGLCDYLDDVLQRGDVVIDHAIIPMRDLYAAAQSRREVARRAQGTEGAAEVVGGLWHTRNPDAQEAVLTQQLYKLMHTLARHDVPLTLLDFPKFVYDPEYLYRKLGFALPNIGYNWFLRVFRGLSRPELVHNFRTPEAPVLRRAG
jgi:hypothetical protein